MHQRYPATYQSCYINNIRSYIIYMFRNLPGSGQDVNDITISENYVMLKRISYVIFVKQKYLQTNISKS
jgi:hypothetical protein